MTNLMISVRKNPRHASTCICLFLLACWLGAPDCGAASKKNWYKGNLHTHSFWSDGDDFPEMIVDWYRRHGYHFLALSDHNTLSVGEKWIAITNNSRRVAHKKYQERMGEDWLHQEQRNDLLHVRLKTLEEFRPLFEEPGKFLLIQSEEISDRYKVFPVHINATHVKELLLPQGGDSVYEVMQRNVDAILEQRRRTGQPMIPHLNHPNFHWAIMAEDLSRVRGERFFEVYNGHPEVHNEGDHLHPDTDKIWDIVLTKRIDELGLEPLYGIGVDDSHHYHEQGPKKSNTGRGWIMVMSASLSAEDLIEAMEAGDFYASSGVELNEVTRKGSRYVVEVKAAPGASYRIQFIGTRKNYDRASEPVTDAAGNPLPISHRYSKDVGTVLKEVKGTRGVYKLKGDELYVRARVLSDQLKPNSPIQGEVEKAWAQPLIPAPRR